MKTQWTGFQRFWAHSILLRLAVGTFNVLVSFSASADPAPSTPLPSTAPVASVSQLEKPSAPPSATGPLAKPSSNTPPPGGWILDITIEMIGVPEKEVVDFANVTAKTACVKFAKFLIKNKGLLATGPFQSVKCSRTSTSAPLTTRTTEWVLKVDGDDSKRSFNVYLWSAAKNQYIPMALYSIDTKLSTLALMNKDNTNAQIAFVISQKLPFRSTIRADDINRDEWKLNGDLGELSPSLVPDNLAIMQLCFDDGLWKTQVVGSLDLDGKPDQKATWTLESPIDSPAVAPDTYYFVQLAGDRRETIEAVKSTVNTDLSNFFGKLISAANSAYIGFRYGAPIEGQDVLRNAAMIGIFGEFRGGLLAGLKLNYDFIPAQTFTSDTQSTKFSWSRFQLGYSFGRELSIPFINWIDITPKLGVTSINYSILPITTSSNNFSYAFGLTHAPTIGGEVGIEHRSRLFLLRAYGFGSYSVGILTIDRNHTTSSLRYGMDAYRDLFTIRSLRFAGVLFGMSETTNITNQAITDADVVADPSLVRTLTYNTTDVGLGLTVTW